MNERPTYTSRCLVDGEPLLQWLAAELDERDWRIIVHFLAVFCADSLKGWLKDSEIIDRASQALQEARREQARESRRKVGSTLAGLKLVGETPTDKNRYRKGEH